MSASERRSSDQIISRVEQKLDDHIEAMNRIRAEISEWQKTHLEWCRAEIIRLDAEISPLKKAFSAVEAPIKWVGWLITGTLTGTLLWLGNKLMILISKHWSP